MECADSCRKSEALNPANEARQFAGQETWQLQSLLYPNSLRINIDPKQHTFKACELRTLNPNPKP